MWDRLIIDLSLLNLLIPKSILEWKSMNTSKISYSSDDFLASIALWNASLSIPLHKNSKKFCSSEFKGNRYNLNVLFFGLTSSKIFTKIMKPVFSRIRYKNIEVSPYVDDIFIRVQSEDIQSEMKNEMTLFIIWKVMVIL